MIKATVLYGHPESPDAFEKYYEETHAKLVEKMAGIQKFEVTKFLSNPDGSNAAFYRMAELYFAGPAEMQQSFSAPEGQATAADLANFATGGVTMLFGELK